MSPEGDSVASSKAPARAVPRHDGTMLASVIHFAATFPLAVRVSASSGGTWRLDVRQNYVMSNMDKPAECRLHLRFDIVAQAAG
jgi:hypothetical protein